MPSLITLVGLATILYVVAKIGLFVFQSFVYNSTSVKKYFGNGQWAVVTGATAGIGEGFAHELAKRGANVVIVGRSEDKLSKVEKEITEKYKNVQVKKVVIDFAQEKPQLYSQKLSEAVSSLKVSILVNNVGVNNSGNLPFFFLDQSASDFQSLVDVNINSALYVTKTVMPNMLQNANGGLVLNLSSYTAKYPTPMNAVYSATKAFLDAWSQALSHEYASKKIKVYSLLPMYVKSDMTGFRNTSLSVCSGQKLASDTFKSVDAPLLGSAFSPYFVHRATMAVLSFIPEKLLAGQALKQMIVVRKKLLARAEKAQNEKKKE